MTARDVRIGVSADAEVSALWLRPDDAWCAFAFAHGAGAGMRHDFMRDVAEALASEGVATLRYDFPYMEAGRRWPPDRPPVLLDTVGAAVARLTELADGLPLLAGGKSLGGRMTSTAAAQGRLGGVRAVAFFGFPLHPAKRPSTDRADHLPEVGLPMLFLQGTRDDLADLELIRPVVAALDPPATLHVVEGADHGFDVLRRSGRTRDGVMSELADAFVGWARSVVRVGPG